MQKKEEILSQIALYFEATRKIPVVKILDEHNEIFSILAKHPLFKNSASCSILSEHCKSNEYYNNAFVGSTGNYFIFFGNFGFPYCFKPIYLENQRIGTVILGGFRLLGINYKESITDSFFKEFIKEEKNLPQVLSREEIRKLFHQSVLSIDQIIHESEGVFFSIIHSLKNDVHIAYTLKDLSKKYFICESHIRRLFHTHTGESFLHYYRAIKLEQGKRIYQETKLTPQKIVEELGYIDNRYLLNEFKKLHTM